MSHAKLSSGIGVVFVFLVAPAAPQAATRPGHQQATTAAVTQPASPADKAEALSEAARKGDAAAVRKLLDDGVDVNTKFRYGATPLSYASDRGHLDVVKLLIERGADVNVTDTFYKATPLIWAVNPAMGRKPQHPEVVRLLLQHGAQGKETALLTAVSRPDAELTRVILEVGGLRADTLSDALAAATNGKHTDIVTLLEHAGAKPRVEVKLDAAQLARYVGSYRGIRAGAAGDITLKDNQTRSEFIAWSMNRGGPYIPTPVIYGDQLYVLQNNGVLAAYSVGTGQRIYQERIGPGGSFSASPVAADGKIYLASEDGDIFVVKAGPSYELMATNHIGQVIMATPAISDGTIFIRGLKDIFAIRQRP